MVEWEDVTAVRRAECERLVLRAGHCSPAGSVHLCARCAVRVRWGDVRWVVRPGIPHPVPVHDCGRPFVPSLKFGDS